MRDYEFRGKTKGQPTGTYLFDWAFGDLVRELKTKRMFICDLSHFDDSTKLKDVLTEVIPETVGQYTGLLDKNDTKIFEGDIVKWGHLANSREKPIRIAVVEFNPDIQYRTVTMGDTYFKQGCFAYAETQFYLEVIGNIHENPEMLEAEK
jgi:uncharacterized phage protein (TIGR01671 family)